MSQFDKLIQKILDEKDITYQEAEKFFCIWVILQELQKVAVHI